MNLSGCDTTSAIIVSGVFCVHYFITICQMMGIADGLSWYFNVQPPFKFLSAANHTGHSGTKWLRVISLVSWNLLFKMCCDMHRCLTNGSFCTWVMTVRLVKYCSSSLLKNSKWSFVWIYTLLEKQVWKIGLCERRESNTTVHCLFQDHAQKCHIYQI